MPKPRSSRRAPPLKDSDYDHEITLFDSAADDNEAGDGGAGTTNGANGAGGGTGTGDAATRSASPSSVISASNTALDAGDGAGSEATSRRPSGMALSPISGAALSPVVTATSLTPLLNTLSTTSAATSTSSRPPSRGRKTTQYGSISKIVSAPVDGAPSVQVEDATPEGDITSGGGEQQQLHQPVPISDQPGRQSMQSTQSVNVEQESAIDILYENERGGFLCGIALFSRQALGNLDPSPWTNYAHGTSPTDIHNAQVPDPTWEWAWPEWRVNHNEDGHEDEDGWEYSFMFSSCFSWHGPTWYSSFVRRRAWIRKRVKRMSTAATSLAASAIGLGEIDSVTDPHLLNPEYFTVLPAAAARRSSSRASSRHASRLSLAAPSMAPSTKSGGTGAGARDGEDGEDEDGSLYTMPKEITDAGVLMRFLRAARIDREKIEAVDNFIEHAGEDLVRLQDFMHEIMALFVFQASRQTLLTHLTKAHDAAVATRQKATADAEAAAADKGKAAEAEGATAAPDRGEDAIMRLRALGRRVGYLTAAAKHADEEVRRLEYWSDIKAMAQRGATTGAVGGHEGWDAHQWQGVDSSGPAPPPPKSPPVSRPDIGRRALRIAAHSRLYGTAANEASANDTVVSWTAIAKVEEERRQRELDAERLGHEASDSIAPAADTPVPTQGDILIESFAREPLVPRPPNLSVLVTPAVKYDNYRETNRSKVLHGKSVIRQARLEAIRQAQLKPLPDWRAVLQQLVGNAPRQTSMPGTDAASSGGVGAILSAMSMSSPPPRRSGSTTAAASLARLYTPDPLKQHLLRQLPPDASASEYRRNAMSFALPDNSPSVDELLDGVDETLWAIAERTGCVLRLYRRGIDEASGATDGTDSDPASIRGQERGYRPWLLTLSGTIPSVYRAADELTSFAKDALPVTIGADVLLKDKRRRDDAVFSPHAMNIGAHQIQRPDDWTSVSLERYVAALTNGRPPAHLAPKLYPQQRGWSRRQADDVSTEKIDSTAPPAPSPATATATATAMELDTPTADGNPILNSHDRTVVNLLLSLFHEEAAKHALSMSAFKMALEFMCKHGETYRPEVRSLFERAESVHVPMDAETFNILLASQVKTQDLRNFGATLALMNRRGMKPDLTTWLLFLSLFESEEVKRHILRTMHASRRDLLDIPDALRSIAQELVEYDARRAVFQRKHQQEQQRLKQEQEHSAAIFIDEFIGRQTERYGAAWLSRTAANRILEVFGSYGLFPECLALLAVLRQQQLQHSHKEAYREQQQQQQQQQQNAPEHDQPVPPVVAAEDTYTINTITYNIVLTHAKLHNSLPKAMAVIRHMEGLDSNPIEPPALDAGGVHAEDTAQPLPPVSSPPPSRVPVAVSVAADGSTLQMLFEMAHQRRLPHLLGALWAYASVSRKTTHLMRKRAGQILASKDPPNKTPLLRALHVGGQPGPGKPSSPSPIPTGNAASERISRRHDGWEPAVLLSQVMQEALNRDKMLLQDRVDRGGRSNSGRPLPPPLRIPLRRKPDAQPKAKMKSSSRRTEENGVAYIEVQADWMLPTKAVTGRTEAETAVEETTTGGNKAVAA
ncbi:hypothetical protein SCUCBS95973_004643 [Sporothrix curviconia]|uniref:Peroxin/Ferlin domain-containing protein n=1 Tax=Sporothrix curviconia TaxID=1260050 RepID=A0ABP0BQS5_9PEZI